MVSTSISRAPTGMTLAKAAPVAIAALILWATVALSGFDDGVASYRAGHPTGVISLKLQRLR